MVEAFIWGSHPLEGDNQVQKFLPRPLTVAALLMVIVALVGCQGAAPVAQPATPAPAGTPAPAVMATDTPITGFGTPETLLATDVAETPPAGSGPATTATPITGFGAPEPLLATDVAETPPASGGLSSTAAALPSTPAATPQGTPSTLPVLGAGLESVTYTASDTGYQGPASFQAGWTRLSLSNAGTRSHDLMLIGLAAGKTITDVLSVVQSQGPPDWVTFYGGVSAGPGESAYWVVDPLPGNYVILSFGQVAPGQAPDAMQGLLKQIAVTAAPTNEPQPGLPDTSATISMVDYNFVLTGTLTAGSQTVKVANNGKEIHEAEFLPLKPGKSMSDFNTALNMEMSGTPVPRGEIPVGIGPSVTLSPGVTVYYPLTLQAGDYVLACFIPSLSHGGEPHAALGMVRQLTVR